MPSTLHTVLSTPNEAWQMDTCKKVGGGGTVQVVLVAAAAQALLAEFDEKRRQGKRKRGN